MKTEIPESQETKPDKPTPRERLSPDGKWKSFPKVPHLLQYTSTGVYFARVKVNGKLIREPPNHSVF